MVTVCHCVYTLGKSRECLERRKHIHYLASIGLDVIFAVAHLVGCITVTGASPDARLLLFVTIDHAVNI
jgi:hypothetical protein